jgi:hypothetical protein
MSRPTATASVVLTRPGMRNEWLNHVSADPRGAGAVEVNRGDDCAVVRDEEVAVHRRGHSDERQRPDAQRKAERHERACGCGLAVKQHRRKEQAECEGPWQPRLQRVLKSHPSLVSWRARPVFGSKV